MDKRKTIIAAVVMLIVAIGGAWAMGYFHRTDPAVAEMQQMRDALFANRDVPEADRRQQWQDFRQKMDGLTDEQRQQFWESGRDQWQQVAQRRMNEFFKMPPAEQQKRLDDIIDRMVQGQNNPNRGNGNGGAFGNGGGFGGGFGGRGGGGRGGGGRNMSEVQRDQRSKERIARTDPQMRAQRDVFRQMLTDRMKQRGITPPPGGGGPPWRGGGGFFGGGRSV